MNLKPLRDLSRATAIMEKGANAFDRMSVRLTTLADHLETTQGRIGTLTSKLDAIEKQLDDQRTQVPRASATKRPFPQ